MKEQKKQTIRKNFVYDSNEENPEKRYRPMSEDFSKTKKFNNLFNDEEEEMAHTDIQPIVDQLLTALVGNGDQVMLNATLLASCRPSADVDLITLAAALEADRDAILTTLINYGIQ